MGCGSSTTAEAGKQTNADLSSSESRKVRRRKTIDGPMGLSSEGSKYAVKDVDEGAPNYGYADAEGAQPLQGKQVAGLPILYGSRCRAGFNPTKRRKPNQDCFVVIENFCNRKDQVFVGVFDGHGVNGKLASHFCRKNLPKLCERALDKYKGNVENSAQEGQLKEMIRGGCYDTSKGLSESSIDVYVSGTTCISAIICGRKIWTMNVGDSRAVLAKSLNGRLKAVDLSVDQKPDRPDEQTRILKRGGRVFEWGVPRVWLKDVDMPGLAMSRSFGDLAAESVGVNAVPEITETFLGTGARFLIFASDGVWEFISSQEAVDIVGKCHNDGKSPQQAAVELVDEGVRRWKRNDDSIDDTTAVVMYLNFDER
jgi:serine/threonine protein phosphatase PrpC